jgi:hypothetical protein
MTTPRNCGPTPGILDTGESAQSKPAFKTTGQVPRAVEFDLAALITAFRERSLMKTRVIDLRAELPGAR